MTNIWPDSQMAIPPSVKEASEVLEEYTGSSALYPNEATDLTMSFTRLLGVCVCVREDGSD